MSLLKGAHLATYLLGAPGAAGTAAHLLTSKYLNLMNFEGNFFLVKAVTELYDDGIPKIPENIKSAVEKIVQQLQQATQTVQVSQVSESREQKQEVFQDKKYWCRYFDYSRGPQNVIMEYDRDCVLYNIFDIKDDNVISRVVPLKVAAVEPSSANTTSNGGKVYDISSINKNETSIESKKVVKNNDFVKGAFYLLSLDKSKFSRLNTLTHIELTEAGNERMAEQTYQTKIATLKIKAPMKGDIKDLKLSFMDDNLPSSVLLLKKVKKTPQVQTTAVAAGGSGGGKTNKSYFLKKNVGSVVQVSNSATESDKKLQVLGMWEFPPTQKGKNKLSKLDLRYLDKVLWDELKKDSNKTPYVRFGILGFILDKLLKLGNGSENTQDYENYFIAKTLSDFWNYKVGDKVQLIETTESESSSVQQAALSQASTTTVTTTSTSEENLAEFEVVSGLLVHLNSPIQCIPDSSSRVGELVNLSFKRNFAKKANSVFSERNNPNYCKPPQNGLPPYTIIFLGANIADLNEEQKT